MIYRYQKDIYRCSYCKGWVAYGDAYCKNCGHKFSASDAERIKRSHSFIQQFKAPFSTVFDNNFNCLRCAGRISSGDGYCKHCGHGFTEDDVKIMRGDGKSNTINHYLVAIPFFIAVIIIFALFIEIVT